MATAQVSQITAEYGKILHFLRRKTIDKNTVYLPRQHLTEEEKTSYLSRFRDVTVRFYQCFINIHFTFGRAFPQDILFVAMQKMKQLF